MIKKDIKSLREENEDQLVAELESEIHEAKDFKITTNSISILYRIIRIKRISSGLTQEELCKKIKVNRSTYSRYESGERQIPNEVLDKILEGLDLIISIEAKEHDIYDEMGK